MTLLTVEEGFSLIDMIFVCGIIGILATIAVPRLLTAKNSASAASAIATMRTISTAQLSFAISCGNGFYAPDLPSLAKPPVASSTGFVPRDLGSAVTVAKSGFNITMEGLPVAGAPDTCNALGVDNAARAFRSGADPMDPAVGRYFATNALNVIYEDTASLYAAMPESAPPVSGHPVK